MGKEKDFTKKLSRKKIRNTNEGRDRQLFRQAKYDIVSHTSLDTAESLPTNENHNAGIRHRNFCILSNKDVNGIGEFIPHRENKIKIQSISEKTKREFRNFDVIKNKYVKDHERKMKIESEFEKKSKCTQYLNQNTFDPVLGKYLDPRKESKISKKEFQVQKTQYGRALENRPTWHKFSEGGCEDIITGEKKSKNIPPVDQRTQRHLRTYAAGYKQNKKWNQQCQTDAKTCQELIINRKKRKGYESGTLKERNTAGYNIINNKPFVGRTGVGPKKPRAHDPETVWKSSQRHHHRLTTNTDQLHRISLY